MVVEELQVDGFERLVVVVAVFVARGLFALHEVVVERYEHGLEPQHAQVDAQALGRGGLAARRGARNEHRAHAPHGIGFEDGVGHFGQLAFVERLGEFDHAPGVARQHLRVHVAHRGHAHDVHPALVFAEDVRHLLLVHAGVDAVGRRAQRQRQAEAVVAGFDVEEGDVARGGCERTVEVARQPVESVEVAVQPWPRIQEGHLVVEALAAVDLAHLAGEGLPAADGQVGVGEAAHAVAQGRGLLAREFVDALDLAVEAAAAHRVADVELAPGVALGRGLLEQKPAGALVDADAFERGDVDEADGDRGIYFVSELLDAVVHVGREERTGGCDVQFAGDVAERGAHRRVDRGADVFACDLYGVRHTASWI